MVNPKLLEQRGNSTWYLEYRGRSIVRIDGFKIYDGPTDKMSAELQLEVNTFKAMKELQGESPAAIEHE